MAAGEERQVAGEHGGSAIHRFGPFTLDVRGRRLMREGEQVELGSRALDMLILLVQAGGALVTKQRILEQVWPNQIVEETNLRANIRALRQALGDDGGGDQRYIVNVTGRGYAFVAPVATETTPPAGATPRPTPTMPILPLPVLRIVGREDAVVALSRQLEERRLVTIVGSGGIGKTTVAAAVARAVAPRFAGAVAFIDFVAITRPDQAAPTLAAALGIPILGRDPLPEIAEALRQTPALIILDNCEHVLEGVAPLAETLLHETKRVHVLATSREALDARGEWVHRLTPLDTPPEKAAVAADEALAYPAVQLFVARAEASASSFALTEANISTVCEITRRLDGMPLAIELGASLVGIIGVQQLARDLGERLVLVSSGRRTAGPRHRTISAMLDWSHELLSPEQKRTLRRLAIFAGRFSLAAAITVAGAEGGGRTVVPVVADLLAKSMLAQEAGGYRLLETTRAYAFAKLREAGEHAAIARRHAELVLESLRHGAATGQDAAPHALPPDLGNIQAALDWANGPDGDHILAVDLTIAAAPYWVRRSMLRECSARIQQALAIPTGDDEASLRRRLLLLQPLVAAEGWGSGPERRAGSAWAEILDIAEKLNDDECRLDALRGLWISALNGGDVGDGLAVAERFRAIAVTSPDSFAVLAAERMIGLTLHFLGEHDGARACLERVSAGYDPQMHGGHILRYGLDQEITARIRIAVLDWLQGRPDAAMRQAEAVSQEAMARGHAFTTCSCMGYGAIPVALLRGDLDAAERFCSVMLDEAGRSGLHIYLVLGRCIAACIEARRDATPERLLAFRRALEAPPLPSLGNMLTPFRAELACVLMLAGEHAEAATLLEWMLARCRSGKENWYVPELLRIQAGLAGPTDPSAAEALLRQGIDLARSQRTPAWELRLTTDLAALLQRQGRAVEALPLLAASHGAFSEGFESADLAAAGTLLERLRGVG
jgi:predicted ATPase/DNA-binding winged helix-turn-helix (wHTH) protein